MKTVLRTLGLVCISFVVVVMLGAASPSSSSLPVVKTKTHSVALFKNGLGFFIKSGEVNPQNGWAVLEDIPHASLGSLWLGSLDKDYPVEDIIGFKDDTYKDTTAISMEELLRGNIGKKVSILYSGSTITGILKEMPEDREANPDGIVPMDYARYNPYPSLSPSPLAASVVLIETLSGEVAALNKNMIQQVWFPEGYSNHFLLKERVRKFKLKLDNRKKTSNISLSYLQKGISWMPSYLVDINDSGKAQLTMKSVVINDAEDVDNAEMFFVVGFPNFKYADLLSPMSMDQTLVQFIASLNNPGRSTGVLTNGAFSNVMQQSIVNYSESDMYASPSPGSGYSSNMNLSGASEEDLFLYQKKNVTLRKGERAYYPIFTDSVDYQHVYEWNISDTLQQNPNQYSYGRPQDEDKTKDLVWHSIKLTNSTNYPWTTAPAFTVNGTKPLAQDELSYTPKGGKINLKLTVASDIKAERREFEVERQRNIELYNRRYDLVTVRGELYLKNFKNKEALLEIKKNLTGEVQEASSQGKIAKKAEGLRGANFNSTISWNLSLKPGEEQTLTYTYKVYISN